MQACLFIETKMIGVSLCESVCHKDAPGFHRICWDATFLYQSLKEKIIKVFHWVGVEATYPGFS